MHPPDATVSDLLRKRYRRLTGPFTQEEDRLFDCVLGFLQRTGARVLTAAEPDGLSLWRLQSECETYDQTAARLKTRKRR